MLMLTRRRGEKIRISDARTGEELAVLTVKDLVQGEARLGIEAPSHIRIMRTEIDDEHGSDR